jgi:hypothetical protein
MEVRNSSSNLSYAETSSQDDIPTGQVYDGPNSAPPSALKEGLSWKHWLTEPDTDLQIQDSKTPLHEYA